MKKIDADQYNDVSRIIVNGLKCGKEWVEITADLNASPSLKRKNKAWTLETAQKAHKNRMQDVRKAAQNCTAYKGIVEEGMEYCKKCTNCIFPNNPYFTFFQSELEKIKYAKSIEVESQTIKAQEKENAKYIG